jgi:uncharacterized protein YeaO (DUF488 family)
MFLSLAARPCLRGTVARPPRERSPVPASSASSATRSAHRATLDRGKCRSTLAVQIKRVYDPPSARDGYRVLIDRVWPRGVSRENARLDEWARELAPSGELRRWFAHDPERFDEFRERYCEELSGQRERVADLRRRARRGKVTILYAARDEQHNNAVVLAEELRSA